MYENSKPTIINSLWKRILLYFLLFFIISSFQINFLDIIKLYDFLPDLLLILVVWVSLREGIYIGLILAFFAGIIHDSMALNPYGLTALCYIIPIFIIKFLKSKDYYQKDIHTIRFVFFVSIATLISTLIKVVLTMNIFTENIQMYFIEQVLGVTLYTAIFSLFPVLIKANPRRF